MTQIPNDYATRFHVWNTEGVNLGLGTHIGLARPASRFSPTKEHCIVLDTGEIIAAQACRYETATDVSNDVCIRVTLSDQVNVFERPEHALVKTSWLIPRETVIYICWFEAIIWDKKPVVFAVTKRDGRTMYLSVDQLNFPIYGS